MTELWALAYIGTIQIAVAAKTRKVNRSVVDG